jgi:hypothetical protein
VIAGHPPFSGAVDAGPHRVTVHRDGWVDGNREITITAGGVEQIKETLQPMPGTDPNANPDAPPPRAHVTFGLGYGAAYGDGSGIQRVVLRVGLRFPHDWLEIGALYGDLGENNSAYGAEARLFFLTHTVRPFARVAGTYGKSDAGDVVWAGEAAGGILIGQDIKNFQLQYVAELGMRYLFQGVVDPTVDMTDHRPRVSVTFEFGFLIPF